MKFYESFVDDLLSRTREVECRELKLVQNIDVEPCTIIGAGYLKSTPEGKLSFKIFSAVIVNGPSEPINLSDEIPGKIIDKCKYFCLWVTDMYGKLWTAERVLPDVQSSGSTSVEGDIWELRRTEKITSGEFAEQIDATARSGTLTLWFENQIELPSNAGTSVQKIVVPHDGTNSRWDDNFGPRSMRSNILRFSCFGCDFDIIREESGFTVSVFSLSSLPANIIIRVQESLQFLLGIVVDLKVLRFSSGDRREVRIHSLPDKLSHARIRRPLQSRSRIDVRGEYSIKLFTTYFTFVSNQAGESNQAGDWHPCSIHLYHAIVASSSSLEAYALGLGVAVEGICKAFYKELGRPSSDERSTLVDLIAFLEGWPATVDTNIHRQEIAKRLLKRVKGALEAFNQSRALDQLNPLVELGAIEEEHVTAWKRKVRNPSSHAELPDPTKIQELAHSRFSVNVLLYHLIFNKIGYEGFYTDYSIPGFPERYYRSGDIGGQPMSAHDIVEV